MFIQSPEKVEANPLRKELHKKGYSVRHAAAALGILPSTLVAMLDAHDPQRALPQRIKSLPSVRPKRKPSAGPSLIH